MSSATPPGPPPYAYPGYSQAVAAPPRLPRSGTLGLILGFLAAMGVAALVPLVVIVLSNRGMSGAWRMFKEGGGGMWLVLLFALVVGIGVSVAGSLLVRGMRVPGGVLFASALLPYEIGILGATASMSVVVGAVSGESVDPSQRARIMAEGISELSSCLLYGALVSSSLAWCIFVLGAFSTLALDRRALPRVPAGAAPWVGLGVTLFALVASVALRFVLHAGLSLYDLLAFVGILGSGLAAGLAFTLRAAAASDVTNEGGRAWRSTLMAALALGLALFLLNRASMTQSERLILGAISGESVDPSQKARILAQGLEETRSRHFFGVVDALGAMAAFVPALFAGMRARPKLSLGGVIGGVGAVAAVALLMVHDGRVSSATSSIRARGASLEDWRGVELPRSPSDASASDTDFSRPVKISASGAVLAGQIDAAGCGDDEHPLAILADKGLTFEALVHSIGPAMPPEGCAVALVATPEQPIDVTKLGPYAGLVGPNARLFAATLQTNPATAPRPRPPDAWGEPREVAALSLAVVPEADAARIAPYGEGMARSLLAKPHPKVPLGTGYSEARERNDAIDEATASSQIGIVLIAVNPSDDVSRLVSLIAPFTRSGSESGMRSRPRVFLTTDRAFVEKHLAAPEPDPSASGSGIGLGTVGSTGGARAGAVSVAGRLPPEVIQRIVRQSFGRMRACYEQGLARDPKLSGKVVTRFVIDRAGQSSSVTDGGSDLADKQVGQCVRKVFSSLTFPEPEGGIVTVVYPITFTPA